VDWSCSAGFRCASVVIGAVHLLSWKPSLPLAIHRQGCSHRPPAFSKGERHWPISWQFVDPWYGTRKSIEDRGICKGTSPFRSIPKIDESTSCPAWPNCFTEPIAIARAGADATKFFQDFTHCAWAEGQGGNVA